MDLRSLPNETPIIVFACRRRRRGEADLAGDMQDNFIHPCLTSASEIAQIVENFEDKQANADDASDFAELKVTVNLVRSTLVPFLTSPVNEVAFDICVQGIKISVELMKQQLADVDDQTSANSWYEKKIALYKEDFALKQKLDQFTYLFPQGAPSKGADMIVDEQGREFWLTAFGRRVPSSLFYYCIFRWLMSNSPDADGTLVNILPRASKQIRQGLLQR